MPYPPHHRYLLPAILKRIDGADGGRVLDIGCREGTLTAQLVAAGFEVSALDNSHEAIAAAQASFPSIDFRVHDIYEPLPGDMRHRFDVVLAAEVIEHLFIPRELFARALEALADGGYLIVTTPFHGYWKNLALAVTGKLERHWQPTDFGHVKFFSETSLGALAEASGFRVVKWDRAGRTAPFAASMVLTARPVDVPDRSTVPG